MTAHADHALKQALRSPGLQMALIALGMLAVVTLLFVRSMARPLNHDEEQFIAPAVLLLRDGLLPYRDYHSFTPPT